MYTLTHRYSERFVSSQICQLRRILSQCMHILNHDVHFKYPAILFVKCTSLELKKIGLVQTTYAHMWKKEGTLVFYSCITNQHKFSGLKQGQFITSQSLQVKSLGTAQLNLLLMSQMNATEVSARAEVSSDAGSPLPGSLRLLAKCNSLQLQNSWQISCALSQQERPP